MARKQKDVSEITFLVKTFERPGCVKRLIRSLYRQYPDAKVIIADDSEKSCKEYFSKHYPSKDLTVYELPYDCGLSYGRNYMVDRVQTEYFCLLDDDFILDGKSDVVEALQTLKEHDMDIVGGYIRQCETVVKWSRWPRVCLRILLGKCWKRNYIGTIRWDREKATLYVDYVTNQFPSFERQDIVLNFFVARTASIRDVNRWDNELKLQEHTAFFTMAKERGLKVGFTDRMSALHLPVHSVGYRQFRDRDYFQVFLQKNGIDQFVSTKNGGEPQVRYQQQPEERLGE